MESSLIYVPNTESYECFVVRDSDTIRAYSSIPTNNSSITYRDYYINSHYIYQDGVQNFSSSSNIPLCLDSSILTSQYSYRNDFADICIITFILCFVCFFFVSSVVKCLFKGRKLF